MWVKFQGSLTLSIILYLYLICLAYMLTRELKMYCRLCFLRYSIDRIRYTLANLFLESDHSHCNWAMVPSRFFMLSRDSMNYQRSVPVNLMTLSVSSQFLLMKLIIALLQFQGMFFDSLVREQEGSSKQNYSSSGSYSSPELLSIRLLLFFTFFVFSTQQYCQSLASELFFLEAVELSSLLSLTDRSWEDSVVAEGSRCFWGSEGAILALRSRSWLFLTSSMLTKLETSRSSRQQWLKQYKFGEKPDYYRAFYSISDIFGGRVVCIGGSYSPFSLVEYEQNCIIKLQIIMSYPLTFRNCMPGLLATPTLFFCLFSSLHRCYPFYSSHSLPLQLSPRLKQKSVDSGILHIHRDSSFQVVSFAFQAYFFLSEKSCI